jgi:hypothetical protein
LRLTALVVAAVVASWASAQVPSVPSISRNTVLDLLLFVLPGYLAVQVFQYMANRVYASQGRNDARMQLEMKNLGAVLFALALSLLGGLIGISLFGDGASTDAGPRLFGYLNSAPVIDSNLFLSFLLHLLFALAATVPFFLIWLMWSMAHPEVAAEHSPWEALWSERYDATRHIVAVNVGRTTYFGKLEKVHSQGGSRDLLLEDVFEIQPGSQGAAVAGKFLLVPAVEAHQVLLIERSQP